MYVTLNKHVAVEPFPEVPKAEIKNGVLQPMNMSALTKLKVVFEYDPDKAEKHIVAGSYALVRSDLKRTTTYGKAVYEVDGVKFILIPLDEVLLVQAPETP